MLFAFFAMMYYGVILIIMRTPKKVNDKNADGQGKDGSGNEERFRNMDKIVFIIYLICFLLFNVGYSIRYLLH